MSLVHHEGIFVVRNQQKTTDFGWPRAVSGDRVRAPPTGWKAGCRRRPPGIRACNRRNWRGYESAGHTRTDRRRNPATSGRSETPEPASGRAFPRPFCVRRAPPAAPPNRCAKNTRVIHDAALPAQQHMQTPIAEAAAFPGQCLQPLAQLPIVRGTDGASSSAPSQSPCTPAARSSHSVPL
jgi:hypothetical protein